MRIFAFNPDEHAGRAFAEILKAVETAGGPAIISLQPGRYLFRKEEAAFCDQPVSNTVVYDGNVPRKHVGLLLAGMSDLTIEGNGAELLFDGDMSGIALLNCRNIILRDFSIDWLHPRVVEMRCAGCRGREAILNGDYRFDAVSARALYPKIDFLPTRATGYAPCLCGKKCDVVCYRHLKEKGLL